MDCSTPGFPILHHLPEFAQTHAHRAGDAIQPSCPRLSPSRLAFNLSQHQSLFKWVNSLHQVAKVLELQPQHQSLQWLSGLISTNIDWFDILAIQGTLNSFLQHHSLKPSILWCSAFFTVQLSHPHKITGKNIALTMQILSAKQCLCFLICYLFVIIFLPRSRHLLISCLQSPSTVILEPKKIKSLNVSIVSPCICHELMGPEAMIFIFWMLSFKSTFSLSFFTFKRLFRSFLP